MFKILPVSVLRNFATNGSRSNTSSLSSNVNELDNVSKSDLNIRVKF